MKILVAAVIVSFFCGLEPAYASEGGLGPSPPPPIAGGVKVVPAPAPFSAVCSAPPIVCDVHSTSSIGSGTDCWCSSNGNQYITGKTK